MPLSQKGWVQAREVGKKLKQVIGDESVKFYVSPYKRTRQTYEGIIESFSDNEFYFREEPRLREQDFGNFQNLEKIIRCRQERKEFGAFYYRFPQVRRLQSKWNRVSSLLFMCHPIRFSSCRANPVQTCTIACQRSSKRCIENS